MSPLSIFKGKKVAQYTIVILPFTLIVIYLVALFFDFRNNTDIARTNYLALKDDKTRLGVSSYGSDGNGNWEIHISTTEEVIRAKDTQVSFTFPINSNKEAVYYSKDSNMLLICVNFKYFLKMLWDSNILIEAISYIFIVILLSFASKSNDYGIMSSKRVLGNYIVLGVLEILMVGLFCGLYSFFI